MIGRPDLLAAAANVPALARLAKVTRRQQPHQVPQPLTDDEVAELEPGRDLTPARFTELFNRWIFWGTVSGPQPRGILS